MVDTDLLGDSPGAARQLREDPQDTERSGDGSAKRVTPVKEVQPRRVTITSPSATR
jgi:hypothetical protein